MTQEMTPGPGSRPPAPSGPNLGRAVLIGVVVVALIAGGWLLKDRFLKPPDQLSSRSSQFVCSETGKAFNYELKEGDSIPVRSPFSGKNTGYPAELCYWTKDGSMKETPTPVLLNEAVGKPGPTFCPECGRLVVPHNAKPQAGDTPPPTKEQYATSAPATQRY